MTTKPKIILHIGQHKTGTSSLQQYCHRNRQALADQGILYPALPGNHEPRSHNELVFDFRKRRVDTVKGNLQAILKQADENAMSTILLSAEELSKQGGPFLNLVRQVFEGYPVEVLLYVRNLPDLVISLFQERMKRGMLLRDKEKERFPFDFQQTLKVDDIIEHWSDAFGAEAVAIKSYDREKADLVGHFMRHIGARDTSGFEAVDRRLNQSEPFEFMLAAHMSDSLRNIGHFRSRLGGVNEAHFGALLPKTPQIIDFAIAILRLCPPAISHPKLDPFRDDLLREPEPTSNPQARALRVRSLAHLLLELAERIEAEADGNDDRPGSRS